MTTTAIAVPDDDGDGGLYKCSLCEQYRTCRLYKTYQLCKRCWRKRRLLGSSNNFGGHAYA